MKDFLESAFYAAAALLLWGKIGAIVLSIALVLIGCYKLTRMIQDARFMRSYL